MYLIEGFQDTSKIERLVASLDAEVIDWMETMEDNGWLFTIAVLPAHIDSPEKYGAVLLDRFVDEHLIDPKTH